MARKNPPEPTVEPTASDFEAALLNSGRLGRYLLKKKLGAGGMGAVYLALDEQLNRLVALKILPPEKAENVTLVKRFKAEAQAVAQLTHDNIVRVYESGEIDGYQYIALEYVEGTDVHRLIRKRGRLPVRRSTEIITQVAEALDHAYQSNIVHRDIKPANLLITQAGVVKLTDLGLARVVDENEETSITRAGTTVGTVDYMAPEQARSSKAADVRSDIYSLGCTWYHMLTGTPPYPDGSVTNKLHAHATARIPDPRSINDIVPESIVGVIQRMMAKKQEDRHQTPAELLEDLRAVKQSKKEISTDDLAMLAAGVEEDEIEEPVEEAETIRPRSKRSRHRQEEEVESVASDPAEESSSPRKGKTSKSSGADFIPPREKRNLDDVDTAEKGGFNTEYLIYAGIVLGLFLVIGGAGYLISSVGSGIEAESGNQFDLMAVAVENQEERNVENGQEGSSNTSKDNSHIKVARDSQRPNQQNQNSTAPGSAQAASQTTTMNVGGPGGMEIKTPVIRIIDANRATDANSAHSLAEAIGKSKSRELIIELQTSSFFVWEKPVEISGKLLTIRAGENQPGTILIHNSGALANGLLTCRNGELNLQNLHFGLLGYELPGNQPLSLIKTVDSQLKVQGCSFTLEESRAAPIQLCEFSQNGISSKLCAIEQTLIRGLGWAPFLIRGTHLDFQLDRCLIVTGEQPVLMLDHGRSSSSLVGGKSKTVEPDQREVSIRDSYIYCRQTPIRLLNTSADVNVPPTQFRLLRSSFVTDNKTGNKPFLEIESWPENALTTAGKAQLAHLNWISEESQFAGWKERLQADTNRTRASFAANNDQEWQTFWGNPGLAGSWSENTVRPISGEQASQASVAILTTAGLTAAARPTGPTMNGLQKLKLPPLVDLSWRASHAWATLSTPAMNNPFNSATQRITFDANKEDLGEFLNSTTLPNTVVIDVQGFGLRTCSRIRLANKNIRLEFQTTAGKSPLTLRPIPGKQGGNQPAPWFSVTGGVCEVQNAILRVDPPSNNPLPSSVFDVQGGQLKLTRCYVTGPEASKAPFQTLIKTSGTAANYHAVALEETYLESAGTLVDTDLKHHFVDVNHSVLVSQSRLFLLRHSGGKEVHTGLLQLSGSTFSTRNTAFHLELPAADEFARPRVDAFVRECAFVPAVQKEKQKFQPRLVSANFPLEQLSSRLWWWGNRNGYSTEWMLSEKVALNQNSWEQSWGAGHIKNLLLGPDGVLLKSGIVEEKMVRPSSFELFADSRAYGWGETGKPIGADCTQLDLSSYETEAASGNSAPTKPEPSKVTPRF